MRKRVCRSRRNDKVISSHTRSVPSQIMTERYWQSLWLPRFAGLLLLIIVGLLYILTLDNGLTPEELHGGDLITHQYAQVQARPSNAPGYPLYTMGGWLWFHGIHALLRAAGHPLPNPIPLLSSYSMLWALLALWLLYAILCRTTRSARLPFGNWPIAFLVALFYAVTYFFWYYATTTEQYSSAIAHTLAIVLLFLLWMNNRDNLRLLFALAFLCGLSLAHMVTVAFIVPPVVAAVLWMNPSFLRNPKAIIGSLIAALLPLLSYMFVYVRGAQHPEWWGSQSYTSATQWFWSFVSTSQGREELMWAFEPGRHVFGNGFPALMGTELSWILLFSGLIGIAWLGRPLPFVLYSTLAIYLVFTWLYRYGNWFQVILPVYSLLMIGVGALADRVQRLAVDKDVQRISRSRRGYRYWVFVVGPIVLLIAAIAWRFDASVARADSHNRPQDTALVQASMLLSAPLPSDSAVFASVDNALALQFLTEIWGIRPDIRIVSSAEANVQLRHEPIYATWDAVPVLLAEVDNSDELTTTVVSPEWVCVGISPQPALLHGPVHELSHSFTDDIKLSSYTVSPVQPLPSSHATGQRQVDLTLYWQLADSAWPDGVAVSVRPTLNGAFVNDPSVADAILQEDRQRPAQLLFENGSVSPHDLVIDPYRLRYPEATNGDELGAAVLLYQVIDDGFVNLGRIDLPLSAE